MHAFCCTWRRASSAHLPLRSQPMHCAQSILQFFFLQPCSFEMSVRDYELDQYGVRGLMGLWCAGAEEGLK